MRRQQLQALSREELIVQAERAGVPRPRVLTQAELIDEILKRTAGSERDKTRARGWLGRARDLIATVVEKGLHLPDAAAAIRSGPKGWPPPPPPLPTVTLAEIYAAQGHLERAVAVLDDVLRREPDHQEARELRERFLAQLARGPKSVTEPKVSSAADTEPSPPQANTESAPEGEKEEEEAPIPAAVASPRIEDTTDEGAPPRERATLPSAPPAGASEPQAAAVSVESEGTKEAVEPVAAPEQPAESAAPAKVEAEREEARAEDKAAEETAVAAAEEARAEDKAAEEKAVAVAEEARAEDEAAEETVEAAEEEQARAEDEAAEETVEAAEEEQARAEDEAPAQKPAVRAAVAPPAAKAAPPVVKAALPERYDVDEVVALAVDPSTFYVYWEVRPTTFAHMAAREPHGSLALRVTAVTPGWDGPIVETRDVAIDALHGDHFIHHVRPRADVRVSVGWSSEGRFDPIAIGAEVSAPRAFVAAGAPAPAGVPLDLSEGPHGVAPVTFARPVTFTPPPRAPELVAAGWASHEIPVAVMEGAPAPSPEGTGAGPTDWVWVPGPAAEQIGMSVMLGPSTVEAPRASTIEEQPGTIDLPAREPALSGAREPATAGRREPHRSWKREPGRWGGASESGAWVEESGLEEGEAEAGPGQGPGEAGRRGGPGEAGRWGGASELGRWGGASELVHR